MSKTIQVCGLRVGTRLFGIPIDEIREINREQEWTSVAHTSESVAGLINIRGQIQVVMDLAVILGIEHNDDGRKRRLVILEDAVAEGYGLIVDRVEDIIEVDLDQVERRSSGDLSEYQIVAGAYQLPQELLVLLDAASVADLTLVEAAGAIG
jgi:purine-binding chemotaxis protein CheW